MLPQATAQKGLANVRLARNPLKSNSDASPPSADFLTALLEVLAIPAWVAAVVGVIVGVIILFVLWWAT
jgi:hypothetical protein